MKQLFKQAKEMTPVSGLMREARELAYNAGREDAGERPARQVQIPRKTDEDKKVSQTVPRSAYRRRTCGSCSSITTPGAMMM